jgi:hypothetical protein
MIRKADFIWPRCLVKYMETLWLRLVAGLRYRKPVVEGGADLHQGASNSPGSVQT